MTFKVMDRQCDQCLYSPRKIVSDRRRKQIIRETAERDSHFICHKGSLLGEDICCRGSFAATGGGKIGRFAQWLGVVKFVSADEYEARARVEGRVR